METVRSLRQKGYRVRVFHTRPYKKVIDEETPPGLFEECGGSTEVQIFNSSGDWVTTGTARCSFKENYDKKKGVRIALGRALDLIPFDL